MAFCDRAASLSRKASKNLEKFRALTHKVLDKRSAFFDLGGPVAALWRPPPSMASAAWGSLRPPSARDVKGRGSVKGLQAAPLPMSHLVDGGRRTIGSACCP